MVNKKEIALQVSAVAIGLAARYALYKKGHVKSFWYGLPSIHKVR